MSVWLDWRFLACLFVCFCFVFCLFCFVLFCLFGLFLVFFLFVVVVVVVLFVCLFVFCFFLGGGGGLVFRYNSSLVCMFWDYLCVSWYDICVLWNIFFYTHLYCLVGCLSMIVKTHTVLDVLYACVLYFCICILFSAIEHDSHGKAL